MRTTTLATKLSLLFSLYAGLHIVTSLSTEVNHVNLQLRISFVTGNEMKVRAQWAVLDVALASAVAILNRLLSHVVS